MILFRGLRCEDCGRVSLAAFLCGVCVSCWRAFTARVLETEAQRREREADLAEASDRFAAVTQIPEVGP